MCACTIMKINGVCKEIKFECNLVLGIINEQFLRFFKDGIT